MAEDFFDKVAKGINDWAEISRKSDAAEREGRADATAGRASDGPYFGGFTSDSIYAPDYERGYRQGSPQESSTSHYYDSIYIPSATTQPQSLGCALPIAIVVIGIVLIIIVVSVINSQSPRHAAAQAPQRSQSISVYTEPTQIVPQQQADTQFAFVQSPELNVRSEPNPDVDTNIQMRLKRGDQVMLTGETATYNGKQWTQIESNGMRGWVNTQYLALR